MYEVIEKSNQTLGCILQNEPEPKIVWLVFDEKCKNSFKHVFSINVLNKINLRLDFSATTICINCAPRY